MNVQRPVNAPTVTDSTDTGGVPVPTSLTDRNAAQQLYNESGASITGLKREVGQKSATSVVKRMKSKLDQVRNKTTDVDQMNKFLNHVMVKTPDANRKVAPDKLDANYTEVSTVIKHKPVGLAIDGTLARVNIWPTALQKQPALQVALDRFQQHGGTVVYGNRTHLDPKTPTLTLDVGNPNGAMPAVHAALRTLRMPDGNLLPPYTAGAVAKHYEQANPAFANQLQTLLKDHGYTPSSGADDGSFYNAVRDRIVNPKLHEFSDGHFDAAKLPGVTPHDATMIMMFRLLYEPLNADLRAGSTTTTPERDALVGEINRSWEKFPPFTGYTFREIGTVSNADVARYRNNVDSVVSEGHYTSASEKNLHLLGANAELAFIINSTNGRSLGCVSPHKEIFFKPMDFLVTDFQPPPPNAPAGLKGVVYMQDVPPSSQAIPGPSRTS